MQQATVNLFADMGVQPATLQAGLVAATASTDTTRADVDDHLARGRRDRAERHRRHDHRHGDRRRRRRRRRASRSRSTAARPGTRATGARAGPTPGRPAPPAPSRSEPRAVDDSGNLEAPGAGDHGHRRAPPAVPVLDLDATDRAGHIRHANDTPAVELGVKFRAATATATSPASASTRAPRTPARTSATSGPPRGTLLATATFTGETASAAGSRSLSSRRWRSPPNTTYVASYFTPDGQLRRTTGGYFTTRATNRGRCTRSPNGADGGNGVYQLRRQRLFPTSTFNATNYWVDVVFDSRSNSLSASANSACPATPASDRRPRRSSSA